MALCPHERYLLTRVLQALLCAAPKNQLVGDRDFRSSVKKCATLHIQDEVDLNSCFN